MDNTQRDNNQDTNRKRGMERDIDKGMYMICRYTRIDLLLL